MSIDRRRASAVCVHQGKILVFMAVDPTSGEEYWFLPGGAIDDGETPAQCAIRETLEETGYHIQVRPGAEEVRRYPFHWDGKDYISTTHFFRADLLSDFSSAQEVQDAAYNKGAAWLPVTEAKEIFSYTPEISEVVCRLLELG